MAQTAAIVIRGPRTPASAMIGFGLIWAFLILFVLYPLTRIFYDAFSNEAGQLTLANFLEFFTDRYYLRSLWNSLVLGAATVIATLHLFPFMTLSILDSLSKVDPSLEEAAQVMGANGWRRFRDVTLPLTTPGYVSGALLVFIWTFADFVTPLVVGVHDLLAAQAYLNIVQFVDRRLFRMGIVISALLVLLAVVFLVAAKHYVAIKDYSSLAYSRVERRRLSGP